MLPTPWLRECRPGTCLFGRFEADLSDAGGVSDVRTGRSKPPLPVRSTEPVMSRKHPGHMGTRPSLRLKAGSPLSIGGVLDSPVPAVPGGPGAATSGVECAREGEQRWLSKWIDAHAL